MAFLYSPPSAGVNTSAGYIWTNTHTFQSNVSISGPAILALENQANLTVTGFTRHDGNVHIDASSSSRLSFGYFFAGQYFLTVNTAAIIYTGNTTTLPTITLANTGSFTIGNNSTTQTTSIITVANSAGNVQITPGTTSINATGSINAASHTVGTSTIANATGVYTTGTVNAASHTIGTTLIANTTGLYHTGLVNAASYNIGTTTSLTTTGVKLKSQTVLKLDGSNYSINNIAVGTGSLSGITTGDFNVGVGLNTLSGVDTGNNNIGIGRDVAGSMSGTSAYNIGIGGYTLTNAFNALGNIGIGYSALSSVLTTGYNTGVGHYAMANSYGGYNTSLGANTLLDNQGGAYNLAVGYNTGRGITSGSYNTIIGSQVSGLAAGLANTIIIADGAGVQRITANSTSVYTVANSFTVGSAAYHVSNGNFGIGTSSPKSSLVITPSTYASTPAPNKIRLFDDGANNYYAMGVSTSGGLDLISPTYISMGFNSISTNTITSTAKFSSGQLALGTSDGAVGLLIYGGSKGIRFVPTSSASLIEGVDNTGVSSYQPLYLGGSALTFTISNVLKGGIDSSGVMSDAIGPVRSIPVNDQTSAYQLASTDNGKVVSITTGGVTVNGAVLSTGHTTVIFNNSGSSQTITIGTGGTMYLSGNTTSANRTLSARGVCTLLMVGSNTFVISGTLT
jgi:hypothetical protein